MSENVAALTGVPRESQYGKTRFELMAPGTGPPDRGAPPEYSRRDSPSATWSTCGVAPTAMAWLSTSGVPVFGGEGRFAGYRGVGREIGAQQGGGGLRLAPCSFRSCR